jgi:cytoskeletal protein CcmA (bactofilin family)
MSIILKKDAVGEKASAGFRIYGKSNVTLSGSASAGFSILACKKLESEKLSAGKKIKAKFIKAETINVARRGKLIGKVQAETVVLNERARAKNLYVSELEMLERSKARNVFADNITIEDYAILSGKVEYTGSINAEEKARIWAKPKKVKELPSPKF